MSLGTAQDWDPAGYAQFHDLRLRPALDLLRQVPDLPAGCVVDLGCGAGAVAQALAARFPGRALIGVDRSAAMLEEARSGGLYQDLTEADVGLWRPDMPPALIFSNAALHWLGDHAMLLPRLAGFLLPGGTLAVQMPRQYNAPSHRFLRDIAVSLFPDRFDFSGWQAPVSGAESYQRLLMPLGRVAAWQTDYVQVLAAVASGHPVRHFTQSTAMRPFLARLTEAEAQVFLHAYDAALSVAYPALPDGAVLMAFRRVFFSLTLAP